MHSVYKMRAIATEWSVFQLVTFVSPAKRLNQLRCHLGADSDGSKEPCIRCRSRSPNTKWLFWGCPVHSKSTGSQYWSTLCSRTQV